MFPTKVVFLDNSTAAFSSDTAAAGTEVDLGPYINVGKREVIAFWNPAITGTDTNETYDVKFQESATTADTDFADISGAAFTQMTDDTAATGQTIKFTPTKRYLRTSTTLGGTTATFYNRVGIVVTARFDT